MAGRAPPAGRPAPLPCPDPKIHYLKDVEELFLDSLPRELTTPDRIHRYAQAYMEKLHANAEREDRRRRQLDKRLAEIEKDNERLTDMLMRRLETPASSTSVSRNRPKSGQTLSANCAPCLKRATSSCCRAPSGILPTSYGKAGQRRKSSFRRWTIWANSPGWSGNWCVPSRSARRRQERLNGGCKLA